MDAAIIIQGHYKYGHKHVIYKKVAKALNKVKLDDDATNEQKRILTELQRQDHQDLAVLNKRHTYTNRVNAQISTEGLIKVFKKPFLRVSREISRRTDENISHGKWRCLRI